MFRHLRRQACLGTGAERFEEVSRTLLHWDMHRRAGLRVETSSPSATIGSVAVLRVGVGFASLAAPVEVVDVFDDPRRRGFVYRTLPGHPESGEESFVVELGDDDVVTFTISAYSRPSSRLARLSGPIGRAVQSRITDRYVRALHTGGDRRRDH